MRGEPLGRRVGIVGAGAWGTALGKVLAGHGNEVEIWAHEPEVARGKLTGASFHEAAGNDISDEPS